MSAGEDSSVRILREIVDRHIRQPGIERSPRITAICAMEHAYIGSHEDAVAAGISAAGSTFIGLVD